MTRSGPQLLATAMLIVVGLVAADHHIVSHIEGRVDNANTGYEGGSGRGDGFGGGVGRIFDGNQGGLTARKGDEGDFEVIGGVRKRGPTGGGFGGHEGREFVVVSGTGGNRGEAGFHIGNGRREYEIVGVRLSNNEHSRDTTVGSGSRQPISVGVRNVLHGGGSGIRDIRGEGSNGKYSSIVGNVFGDSRENTDDVLVPRHKGEGFRSGESRGDGGFAEDTSGERSDESSRGSGNKENEQKGRESRFGSSAHGQFTGSSSNIGHVEGIQGDREETFDQGSNAGRNSGREGNAFEDIDENRANRFESSGRQAVFGASNGNSFGRSGFERKGDVFGNGHEVRIFEINDRETHNIGGGTSGDKIINQIRGINIEGNHGIGFGGIIGLKEGFEIHNGNRPGGSNNGHNARKFGGNNGDEQIRYQDNGVNGDGRNNGYRTSHIVESTFSNGERGREFEENGGGRGRENKDGSDSRGSALRGAGPAGVFDRHGEEGYNRGNTGSAGDTRIEIGGSNGGSFKVNSGFDENKFRGRSTVGGSGGEVQFKGVINDGILKGENGFVGSVVNGVQVINGFSEFGQNHFESSGRNTGSGREINDGGHPKSGFSDSRNEFAGSKHEADDGGLRGFTGNGQKTGFARGSFEGRYNGEIGGGTHEFVSSIGNTGGSDGSSVGELGGSGHDFRSSSIRVVESRFQVSGHEGGTDGSNRNDAHNSKLNVNNHEISLHGRDSNKGIDGSNVSGDFASRGSDNGFARFSTGEESFGVDNGKYNEDKNRGNEGGPNFGSRGSSEVFIGDSEGVRGIDEDNAVFESNVGKTHESIIVENINLSDFTDNNEDTGSTRSEVINDVSNIHAGSGSGSNILSGVFVGKGSIRIERGKIRSHNTNTGNGGGEGNADYGLNGDNFSHSEIQNDDHNIDKVEITDTGINSSGSEIIKESGIDFSSQSNSDDDRYVR